jgi:hypothetical protein
MYLIDVTKADSGTNLIPFAENLAVGVVVALVSAWLTVFLALRRFYSEKWWERKWEAYSGLLDALHHIKNYDDHYSAFEERNAELPEKAKILLTEKLQNSMAEVRKQRDVGSLVISEQAVKAIDDLLGEFETSTHSEIWYEVIELHLAATNKCIRSVCEIAKKDLKRV